MKATVDLLDEFRASAWRGVFFWLKARDFSFIEASELLGSNEEDAVTFGSGVGHFRIPGDGDPDAGGWEKALARREESWLWLLSGWWLERLWLLSGWWLERLWLRLLPALLSARLLLFRPLLPARLLCSGTRIWVLVWIPLILGNLSEDY